MRNQRKASQALFDILETEVRLKLDRLLEMICLEHVGCRQVVEQTFSLKLLP